jgi:hypothetical protein
MSEGATETNENEIEAAPTDASAQVELDARAAEVKAPEPGTGEYEHEGLKGIQGGKYRKLEDVDKALGESSREGKELAAKVADLEAQAAAGTGGGAPKDAATGAPIPYEFKSPEGMEGLELLPADSPLTIAVNEFGQRHNMSAEMAQDAYENIIIPMMAGNEVGAQEHEQQELTDFYKSATVAEAKVKEAYAWAADLAPDMAEDIRSIGDRASTTKVLIALKDAVQSRKMGDVNSVTTDNAAAQYREDIKLASQGDPAASDRAAAYLNSQQ